MQLQLRPGATTSRYGENPTPASVLSGMRLPPGRRLPPARARRDSEALPWPGRVPGRYRSPRLRDCQCPDWPQANTFEIIGVALSGLLPQPASREQMSLTAAQLQAVAARGNVLVVAGAGTGKTRTLVERCLDCLLAETPRASLDGILVVTFTDAAAAEMRQRIRQRLEEERARCPDDAHWQEQLALFETAHLGTLHSFCLQLVRQHFYDLELDPQVSVLA